MRTYTQPIFWVPGRSEPIPQRIVLLPPPAVRWRCYCWSLMRPRCLILDVICQNIFCLCNLIFPGSCFQLGCLNLLIELNGRNGLKNRTRTVGNVAVSDRVSVCVRVCVRAHACIDDTHLSLHLFHYCRASHK